MKKILRILLITAIVSPISFISTPSFAKHSWWHNLFTGGSNEAGIKSSYPGPYIKYTMRVNGWVCPYCAYGIEKKLKKIEGVEVININLQKGLVIVCTQEGITLRDKQMKMLFSDAGFSYIRMMEEKINQCDI